MSPLDSNPLLTFGLAAAIILLGFGGAAIILDSTVRQKFAQLGVAIVTGTFISASFFAVQLSVEDRIRSLEERRTLELSDDVRNVTFGARPLSDTSFRGKALDHSNFRNTPLRNVDFFRASLIGVQFQGTVMNNVNLAGADMCGAELNGADLRGAINIATVARWDQAVYDDKTLWPQGFKPESVPGLRRVREGVMVFLCDLAGWEHDPSHTG